MCNQDPESFHSRHTRKIQTNNTLVHNVSFDQINQYLDNSLSPAEIKSIEAHFAICPECNSILNDLQVLFSKLDALEDVQPGVNLVPQVISTIRSNLSISPTIRWGALCQSIFSVALLTIIVTLFKPFIAVIHINLEAFCHFQIHILHMIQNGRIILLNSFSGFWLFLQMNWISILQSMKLPGTPLGFPRTIFLLFISGLLLCLVGNFLVLGKIANNKELF
jgi:hypothetical protein